jgi:hypothetical protein
MTAGIKRVDVNYQGPTDLFGLYNTGNVVGRFLQQYQH